MKSIKNLLTISAFFLVAFAPRAEAVDTDVSTTDLVKELEKSLIFDEDSRTQIDFYKKQNVKTKSEFTIKAGSTEEQEKLQSQVDIVVVDSKIDSASMVEKERMAYNASLIGQYEVAIQLYKAVLLSDPENSYAKFSLAIIYQKIGQYKQAKTLYYELLKSNADNQEEIVGNILSVLIEESPRDAIYLLSRLAVQNPKSPSILAQAAIANEKVKNYDQAISLFSKAIALDQDNISYKYNLAVIYDKTAQYEKALDLYSNVAKNYSDDNNTVPFDQVQKRIESIRNKL